VGVAVSSELIGEITEAFGKGVAPFITLRQLLWRRGCGKTTDVRCAARGYRGRDLGRGRVRHGAAEGFEPIV